MNYQKIHDRIIDSAKNRKVDSKIHYDLHHIIPRSMGGTDDSENLILLTDKEHFVIHTLLWKIYRNRSMTAALWIMSQNKRYHYKEMNGNRYAALRKEFRKNQTNQLTYKFENILTGEIFEGIRKDFRKYANISYSECSIIVDKGYICQTGQKASTNGANWKLVGAVLEKRIPHNTDHAVYQFENVYTGEEFSGTRKQFDYKISYRSYEVVNNIRVVNGWKLKGVTAKRIPKNKMVKTLRVLSPKLGIE